MKFNIKNKFFRTLTVLFLTSKFFAQNEFTNHKKYWYYKTRLNNDFIKIGLDPGNSIPANERAHIISSPYDFNSNKMQWGDASARLGIYLSVLATEFRLLKNNGQDLTKIKHEIFCALNAINRIDFIAEEKLSNGAQGGNLNGFFMRDDVPTDFVHNNYQHFNYYNKGFETYAPYPPADKPNSKGFTQTFGDHPQDTSTSTWSNFEKDGVVAGCEESQDQAYYLLMGLALTSKLVDDVPDGSNTFGYGSGETKLQTEAKNIAGRIINHIKSDPLWRVRNPANGNAFVQIGHIATPYAYALDNLGCFIKYGQDLPAFTLGTGPLYPYNQCSDFSNVHSRSPLGASSWHSVAYQNGGLSVDQMGFFHILAGSANCIYEAANASNLVVQAGVDAAQAAINSLYEQANNSVSNFLSGTNLPQWLINTILWVQQGVQAIWAAANILIDAAQNVYNHYAMAINTGLVMNTTDYRLFQNTKFHQVNYFNKCDASGGTLPIPHTGSEAYFGTYLKDALRVDYQNPNLPPWVQFIKDNVYNFDKTLLKNDMISILNSAPCNGNFNFGPTNNPGPKWGASDRIDRSDRLWTLNCNKYAMGEYSGLDYLLLHNLFYLTEGTGVPISNYSDRKVSINMPFSLGGTVLFNTTNKKTMGAFEYLTATNVIASNGAANYQAITDTIVAFKNGITALLGKKLKTGTLNMQVNEIDLSNFEIGMYLITVSNENYLQTDRIILQ